MGLIKRVHVINSKAVTQSDTAEKQNEMVTSVNKTVKHYQDVFEGVGCLPGKHKIQLKENPQAVIHPARKVPLALKERLRSELQSLIGKGIIRTVEEPTEIKK